MRIAAGEEESNRLSFLEMNKPPRVYWSVLESGKLALLNFDDKPAVVTAVPGAGAVTLKPYGLAVKQHTLQRAAVGFSPGREA